MPEQDSGLRARLVQVGVELLVQEGTEALSLREIARRAGVSHGAPRRYFATHQALLAAIAREGYRELGQRLAPLADGDADPRAQLHELGRRYLEFAGSHRRMFELMFRHDLLRGNEIGLRQDSLVLFGVLVELVGRALPHATPARQPSVIAGAIWANLHGIAQLWQWGSLQVAVPAGDAGLLMRTALEAHLSH